MQNQGLHAKTFRKRKNFRMAMPRCHDGFWASDSGLPLSHSPYKVKSGWVMFTFPSDGMFTNSEGMQCLGEKKNIDPDVFDHVLKS